MELGSDTEKRVELGKRIRGSAYKKPGTFRTNQRTGLAPTIAKENYGEMTVDWWARRTEERRWVLLIL